MSDSYSPAPQFSNQAHIDQETYLRLYQQSVDEPEIFWAQQAEVFLDWSQPWHTVLSGSLATGEIRWFDGAELNVCYNCVDRHLATRSQQPAIIWQGDELEQSLTLTYQQLHSAVCRFANILKSRGVKKGDRVCIYMPMIVEAALAMLACARIGAIHSVVFGGFSSQALRERILDADCATVITADEGVRGGKRVPLKANVDQALQGCANVTTVLVVKHRGSTIAWDSERDLDYHQALTTVEDNCAIEVMQAEDPLFILYTSGSTGKPKGVLHTSGGYLLYAALTHKYIFDYRDGDIYWCTADVGWITGHSYIVYGPLANGATTLMFEGVPNYPTPSRFWQIVDQHQVTIFYTAPTAIRALMRHGDQAVTQTSRSSLRLLGTVGEPINPEAWQWYYQVVGESRCPIVDTWWQTETGGIMISALPGATPLKPGSATRPLFGIVPALLDDEGKVIDGTAEGSLVISRPWPGMLRTIYRDQQRFIDTYLTPHPGYYTSGDGARRDADGYYWITGRIDDVMNISGHCIGTAEVESALVLHADVAEAAVVAIPHEIKGNSIYAFVCLNVGVVADEKLTTELIALVAKEIGAIAKPDKVQFVADLPKTRSGKIMRRLLRKIVNGDTEDLGDLSTLANAEILQQLIKKAQ
ncbi:MAG: acetate--CoA ligase [Gammaproteobacteria bacterium]|nr:acetate--CoA ligase [Gammaproteobacteria bacterium]